MGTSCTFRIPTAIANWALGPPRHGLLTRFVGSDADSLLCDGTRPWLVVSTTDPPPLLFQQARLAWPVVIATHGDLFSL